MDYPRIQVNMLPVGSGDCIHIQLTEDAQAYNIIIDSGPASHGRKFRNLIRTVDAAGQQVDLLCFTHIDNDHIKGAENLFADPKYTASRIGMIWMNIPEEEAARTSPATRICPRSISCKAACQLIEGIRNKGYPHLTRVTAGHSLRLGSAEIQAVWPDEESLSEYYNDWTSKMGRKKPRTISASDGSPTNGASIVLLLTVGELRLLFAGDAFAGDLERIALRHAGSDGFALVKLPHHGSAGNTTDAMLRAMNCDCFLVSTEGTAKRPSQETIDLLGQYGAGRSGVVLYGNYPWNRLHESEGLKILSPVKEEVLICDQQISIRTEEPDEYK